MTKLYISEKTLDKLSDSKEFQNYTDLLKNFCVKHSKQPNATQQKPETTKTPTVNQTLPDSELDQDTIIRSALQEMKEAIARNRNNYTYSPQKAKALPQKIKEKKRKQQIAKLHNSHKPVTKLAKQLRPKVIKLKKSQRTSRSSSSPIARITYYNDLASEYEFRQVEFGHGRAKSKEWNDEIARKFQKEMQGYHRKRDWTDRFALK